RPAGHIASPLRANSGGIAMRVLLASLLIVLGGLNAAQAQVDDAKVVRRGLYELGKLKTIDDSSISTGHRTEATKVEFKESTMRIEADDGVVFGLDVLVSGSPRGKRVPVRVVWHYPDPGLRNPDTRKAKFKDEYNDDIKIGNEQTYYWSLGAEWQHVPGTWTFELWQGDRRLVKQDFTVVKQK